MIPIFTDFETFYSKEYSLKRMSTQEYIYDPQFKVHGVGLAAGKNKPVWVTAANVRQWLEKIIPGNVVVCHNATFDYAILEWHYGVRPKLIIDTVSLSRALIGERLRSHSLDSIANYLLKEEKGGYLATTMGYRDLSPDQERQLAAYCLQDVELCRKIFYKLIPHLPPRELQVMDLVSRMYTEPALYLDNELLTEYHSQVVAKKMRALDDAGVESVDEIRSDKRFAELLTNLDVEPPTKVSPAWLKKPEAERDPDKQYAYAFAKTDSDFQALREHPDERVQALVEARLENKTTIAESRAEAFINASRYGKFPVPYLYSGAMTTHRLSGGGGFNLQNLPRKGTLRKAIHAPPGHKLVVGDLAQIELRLTLALGAEFVRMNGFDWTKCGEYKALHMLADGADLYCDFGRDLYGREITRADEEDRHKAKECVLGSGYQMGPPKLVTYLSGKGIKITTEFAERAIGTYRMRFRAVQKVWKYLQETFKDALFNEDKNYQLFEIPNVWLAREPLFNDRAVRLPNGLCVKYPGLHSKERSPEAPYGGIAYNRSSEEVNLFGGKILQNMIECLSRDIIFPATVKIDKRFKVVMSTHDELVCVVPDAEVSEGIEFVKQIMTASVAWWPSLPINSEVKAAIRYGEAK